SHFHGGGQRIRSPASPAFGGETSGRTMVVKNPILALACSAALVACGGDDGGSKGAAGGPVLWTEVADEAPGDNCAGGGVRISVGVDDDGDGALDGSEVTTTRYVCNGVSGDGLTLEDIKPLLVVSEEPPGDNCANGGRRLRVGVDRDGDGKLDAAEVESTEYDCHPEALARVHFGSFEVRTSRRSPSTTSSWETFGSPPASRGAP